MTTIFFVVLYTNGVGPGQNKRKNKVQEETVEAEILSGQIGNDLYGWMQYESFFDDEIPYGENEEGALKVNIMAVSVEKDMRIQIAGSDGKPVEGQFFKIRINETDEYLDLDRDGIIYVSELEAGEYQVSLEPREGFAIPAGSTPVKVKDRVEHRKIADISLLIQSEDEVDVMVEDRGKTQEVEEGSEPTDLRRDSVADLGIDVSRWNEEINWSKIKDSGIEYAIIRSGYRAAISGALVEDKFFRANAQGAMEAGIPIGIYFLSQATTEVEAVEEASMVLALCEEYDITYPIFLDVSGGDGTGRADQLTAKERTALAQAFCETIRNSSYEVGIYADSNTWKEKLDRSVLADDIYIWLAEYGDAATYEDGYHIWQYTSSGRVLGIEGRVCLNLSFLEE